MRFFQPPQLMLGEVLQHVLNEFWMGAYRLLHMHVNAWILGWGSQNMWVYQSNATCGTFTYLKSWLHIRPRCKILFVLVDNYDSQHIVSFALVLSLVMHSYFIKLYFMDSVYICFVFIGIAIYCSIYIVSVDVRNAESLGSCIDALADWWPVKKHTMFEVWENLIIWWNLLHVIVCIS